MRPSVLGAVAGVMVVVLVLVALAWPLNQGACVVAKAEPVSFEGLRGHVRFLFVEVVPPLMESLLESVNATGLAEVVKLGSAPSQPVDKALIFVHASDVVRGKHLSYLDALLKLLSSCNKCAVALLNVDPKLDRGDAMFAEEVIMKVYGGLGINPVLPLEPGAVTDKLSGFLLHEVLSSADMLVFTFNPPGTIIVERLGPVDFARVLGAILEWTELVNPTTLPKNARIEHSSLIRAPKGMVLVGLLGWISNYTYGKACGEITGRQMVYVRYYYGNNTSAAGKLYHVWYVYVQHSGVGYETQCNWWIFRYTVYHYPKRFLTTTDWRTTTWPGQVVDDWQPKNVGSAVVVHYHVTSGISVGLGKYFSAEVQYSTGFTETTPGVPYYTWLDRSEPADGIVRTEHVVNQGTFKDSQMTGLIFTVEPSSFGFLDPDRPGGTMPMIITQSFYMELNTGDYVNVTYGLALWSTQFSYWYSGGQTG
ncbi:MAG: hypothetical protein ABWK00_00095 [Desulfurococcaceae archaeon]